MSTTPQPFFSSTSMSSVLWAATYNNSQVPHHTKRERGYPQSIRYHPTQKMESPGILAFLL